MKELKKGDILICKRTVYTIEDMELKRSKFFLYIFNFISNAFPLYKKNKKYIIGDKFNSPIGYFYFIYIYPVNEKWIENVFYTEKDIRKMKLQKLGCI